MTTPVALIDRAGDSRDRGLDLIGGVVAAKPEADTLAAHVGDDVRAREPIVQRLRAGELEGEEMTAPGPDRDRRDQPGISERPHLGARDRRKKRFCSASTWSWIAPTVNPISSIQSNTAACR